MVKANVDSGAQWAQIVLRPNQSWSWRANLALLATLTGISLTIAGAFLLKGLWLVLPFSILEMTVLYFCLRYLVIRNQRQEVITFSSDEVVIERGRRRAEESLSYNRYWAHFCVIPSALPGRDPRIAIRSHGRETEIGGFLSEPDKRALVQHLRDIVALLKSPTGS